MNIAILLSQSNYQNLDSLGACSNDLAAMKMVLEKSKKYDKIVVLDDSVNTASVAKDKLVELFAEFRNFKDIDEVFFYFSGHGSFENEEFFYVWSDYKSTRKRQTCLLNSEIDGYLKSLNSNTVVKVVDACESGVPYLKGNHDVEKLLVATKESFRKCYFMFSSQNDESSLADENMSYFTKSFLKSLQAHPIGKNVRYSEIINYISDDFENAKCQKPFFVTQGDFVDKFISIDSEVLSSLNSILEKDISDSTNSIDNERACQQQDLESLVVNDAKRFIPFENVVACLEKLSEVIQKFECVPELERFYEISVNFYDNAWTIPKKNEIAKWIQKNEQKLYSRVLYKTIEYDVRVPKNKFSSLFTNPLFDSDDNYKIERRSRQEVDSYENVLEIPFYGLNVVWKGKFPNLMNHSLCFVPVLSRVDITFFVSQAEYRRSGWDDQEMVSNSVQWEVQESSFDISAMESIAKSAKRKLEDKILVDLKNQFNCD